MVNKYRSETLLECYIDDKVDFIVLQKQVKSPMKMTSLVLPELETIALAVYIFSSVYMEHLRARSP